MQFSRSQIHFGLIQLTLAAAVVAGLCLAYPSWRLGLVADRMRKTYPDVQAISTGDLASWLASPKDAKPVIFDVRTEAEFAVSHLIGAHRIAPGAELKPDELPDDRRRSIVVYCSTGERSAAFARRLQRGGYSGVLMIEGGIVRWANEDRPMTDERGLVTRVQPFDAQTARLLKGAHRAPTPAAP